MDRCCRGPLGYQCSCWHPQKQIAAAMNRLQNKLVESMVHRPMQSDGSPETCVRRRNRIAGALSRKAG
eukprot:2257374-Alexandrium_andersonii.AAC.1